MRWCHTWRLLVTMGCVATLYAGEEAFLSKVRQLTFEGKRAGEGYFSSDGNWLIFQSERDPANPFYQIYLLDLENGDTRRVSPGTGKTTCAWVHPGRTKALFASTHLDPQAEKKQRDELEFRASGQQRRYAWDYDEHYDLFEADLTGSQYRRLTSVRGYDAEASYSPDGRWIAFASNRHAYAENLSDDDRQKFELDPSLFMDLYIMPAAGGEARRLTSTRGYDGGPFFDAAGERICWRRFSEDGATAEIYTMNLEGAEQRQLTRLGAMSWAPFFHPSGDYLIFTTNLHGFGNFELYLVDQFGEKEPVRVTHTEGFDGLASFSPDGSTLTWTSNRTSDDKSQIFLGSWNDAEARRLLGLDTAEKETAATDLSATRPEIAVEDLRRHVTVLASEEMAGRLTGTRGERLATAYAASVFKGLGLEPAGDEGSYFQEFPFVAGVSLGPKNQLKIGEDDYPVDEAWRPLAFSKAGAVEPAGVVFAGYGMQVPAQGDVGEYDSYVHLDVTDQWVLVLRFFPENVSETRRRELNRFASLRFKAMVARERGAKGLLVAAGPGTQVKEELVKLAFDTSIAGTSIPAISITTDLARDLVQRAGKDLAELQKTLDQGEQVMGFELPGVSLAASVDIVQEQRLGRNVLARLTASKKTGASAVAVGAHIDHLGRGETGGSLAREGEKGAIHYGADDNASGVAGLLEIAQYLVHQKSSGKLPLEHDILFAAWSGEEMGLLGSDYFADHYGGKKEDDLLSPAIAAYLNLDMIGRLERSLVIQGLGSSDVWAGEIERRNAPIGLTITTQNDSYLPTDATSFYLKGVPILSAFTGSHGDYHSPRDTPEKLNYEGMRDTAKLFALITRGLATNAEVPEYRQAEKPEGPGRRVAMRAYLGTIPDYSQGDAKGLKISGVSKGGPAEKAGLLGGDIIVELAQKTIENIYDYTYAIEALKIGAATKIVVLRGEERIALTIVPGSRE